MNELYLQEVEEYVKQLFHAYQKGYLIYHNLQHTKKVVQHCREIAAAYPLTDGEKDILYTAAWFHDTGHLFADMPGHELESVIIMKDFPGIKRMTDTDITAIENCILSTRLPQQASTLLEKILCDADLYHLGTEEFKITDTLVRQELELLHNTKIKNWNEKSLKFLYAHEYFTDYCRQRLNDGKENNIRYLKELPPEEA